MPAQDPNDSTDTRWARPLTPSERAAELARDERFVTRDARRALGLTLLGCAIWLLVGLVLMGWGMHSTDSGSGEIAFIGGLLVGYTGIVVTLATCYLRGEEAGWW